MKDKDKEKDSTRDPIPITKGIKNNNNNSILFTRHEIETIGTVMQQITFKPGQSSLMLSVESIISKCDKLLNQK